MDTTTAPEPATPTASTRTAARQTGTPRVSDVMHGPVVAVDTSDNLWTAMDVMLTRGLRHLVVTRGGRAHGILSDRDLAATWAMDPIGLKNRQAGRTAAPAEQVFLSPDTDVVAAAVRMRELGVDALVVVASTGAPLGVVTDHDLLGVLAVLIRAHA
jgi:signal-transduction protein with cAMP-binding, CBS, and nucleotidyltransferase domain